MFSPEYIDHTFQKLASGLNFAMAAGILSAMGFGLLLVPVSAFMSALKVNKLYKTSSPPNGVVLALTQSGFYITIVSMAFQVHCNDIPTLLLY